MKLSIRLYLALPVLFVVPSLSSQHLTYIRKAAPGIDIQAWSIQLKNSSESSMSSYGWAISGWIRTGASTILKVDLPYVSSTWDVNYSSMGFSFRASTTKSAVGNLSLSILTGAPENDVSGEFHLVIPTLSMENSFAGIGGLLGDPMNFERYTSEVLTAKAGLRYRVVPEEGWMPSFHFSFAGMFPTGSNEHRDAEVLAGFGGGFGYTNPIFGFFAGIDGRVVLTEDSFIKQGNRSVYIFTVEADMSVGTIRPSLFFRVPVDKDLSESLRSVIGAGVNVAL